MRMRYTSQRMTSVRKWPQISLMRAGGIPTTLRAQISAEAQSSQRSVADTIRTILCDHYKLDCPPRGGEFGYDNVRDQGSEKMVLRVQPELFDEIKKDATASGKVVRELILEVLQAHYEEES